MAFRPPKKQPEFADLIGILAQSKTELGNATYQTITEIINRLTQLKLIINEAIDGKIDDGDATKKFATKFATYLTEQDETGQLPNSLQLLAGLNLSFDTTIPNKLTINATGGAGADHVPMSTGAEPLEIMSDGAGQVLLVAFEGP
jgi:hypothetical protein